MSEVSGEPEHAELRQGGGLRGEEFAGAVGASVVEGDDFAGIVRQGIVEFFEKGGDSILFVAKRDDAAADVGHV